MPKQKDNSEMTDTAQQRELDAWIAEHVMGWKLTPSKTEHGFSFWDSKKDGARLVSSWSPTTDPAAAMEVLRKCLDSLSELGCGDPIISKDGNDYWVRGVKDGVHIEGCAPKLELSICIFTKKLFS